MSDVKQFEDYRPLMLSIAYRMLGSMTDAEDIVQKAYLRYSAATTDEIISLPSYFKTIVTRLCLDHLELAHVQRESYIGSWLPEPVPGLTEALAPPKRMELYESLSMAFLVLLEQLSPLERAVFLLREVFDYDYQEIADILEKEEAACRKLFSRAKQHIAANRPRFKPEPEAHRQILDQFIEAVESGELESLLQLLTDDVELWGDGNGRIRGALKGPLYGREAVARFVMQSPRPGFEALRREVMEVNGEAAFVLVSGDEVRLVLLLSLDADRIHGIYVMANPDKLTWFNKSSSQGTSE
ncbi:MAG: RNA polymerase sigma-70 factor [Chloroflexi bacterium]|nr:RNA polymerase sigma-70 factor [Chloroflexota bacterium]